MNYNYQLIRSNRKSVALSINSKNEITVRAPYNTPVYKIENFIQSKATWINKILLKNSVALNLNAEVIVYKKILIGGNSVPLHLGEKNGYICGEIYLKNLSYCKKVLLKEFYQNFSDVYKNVCTITGLKANSIGFKDYKKRWGCCSGNNDVVFNYRMLMLPQYLQQYIILHELCHTIQHNHSPQFWRLVEKFMPEYNKAKSLLKSYTFLLTLY